MPTVNVTLKQGADPEHLEKAKQTVKDKGGEITNEFRLIKGFTAKFPEDNVSILETNEHYDVEEDKVVRTQ